MVVLLAVIIEMKGSYSHFRHLFCVLPNLGLHCRGHYISLVAHASWLTVTLSSTVSTFSMHIKRSKGFEKGIIMWGLLLVQSSSEVCWWVGKKFP